MDLRIQITAQGVSLRAEMAAMRAELRGETAVQGAELRSGMAATRHELRGEILRLAEPVDDNRRHADIQVESIRDDVGAPFRVPERPR